MNNANRRAPTPPGNGWQILFSIVFGITLAYVFVELAAHFRTGEWVPGWPWTVAVNGLLAILMGTFKGQEVWGSSETTAAVIIGVLVLLAMAGFMIWTVFQPKKSASAFAAKRMGKGEKMSLKAVSERSDKSRLTTGDTKGLLLVKTMRGGKERYADFRQTGVIVMGPGAGKTTGFTIPMGIDAPGVVFATTNKRDLVDGLKGCGRKVWVFDPQQICSKEQPAWRLDLRKYITDEVRAHKLAKIWMDASTPLGATKNSYFDSAGPNLLAGLLLACAVSGEEISQVFLWLNDMSNRDPVKILERAGYVLPARSLYGVYVAPPEQAAGVFGTAAEMVSFLNNSRTRSWLEATPGDMRPVFSPENFVRSRDEMMIAVSKEGIGSTGPLTAALTTWVLDAAEELADTMPHGRLQIPLVVPLDEVANVCRIKELPDLMSHYGSRGISIWPILQNFAQGKRVWGEDGMMQLWGAANVRIIGSGQADDRFLEGLAKVIGKHLVTEYSTNTSSSGGIGSGSYSRNISQKPEYILDVEDLAALEPGECVVHTGGARAFMALTIPWYERNDMKELVAASVEKYEPKGNVTV